MSSLTDRIKEVDAAISLNESLMHAALNPTAASAVKARLDVLRLDRTELMTYAALIGELP